MNFKKGGKRSSLKNDLKWLDPDQEMQLKDEEPELAPETFRESLSRGVRSFIAILICVIIPALWYFDWNTSFFANKTSEVVTGFFDEGKSASVAPEALPRLPSLHDIPNASAGSLVDYTSDLNELGLLNNFSSPAVRAFYENGVKVEFLNSLKQANLIDNFSFPAIIAFYQNQIPLDYLSTLKSDKLIVDLSFPGIIAFYQNGVTTDYLNRLRESGFLEELSFPAVVAYFQNDVTVEFLEQLEDNDLLGELSFPSIVEMYKNQ